MEHIEPVLTELLGRLPELEWQLNQTNLLTFVHNNLPNNLFRCGKTTYAKAYTEEIRSDIAHLAQQNNQNTRQYLAETIRRKINTLVKACQLGQQSNNPSSLEQAFMTRLLSRQQQLKELQDNIQDLEQQQEALNKRLLKEQSIDVTLALQAQLGKLTKLLTLARETFAKTAGIESKLKG